MRDRTSRGARPEPPPEPRDDRPRVMPDPWFRAQTLNSPLCVYLNKRPDREPAPDERSLGPFILPVFQRDPVWTLAQRVRFIESIWGGLPLGSWVQNYHWGAAGGPTDGWLLDGQQRWSAIFAYVAGDFEVHGWRFPDLPRADQRRFEDIPFTQLQTQIADPEACREVYLRLTYGGTPHAPRDE